jgi:hypothetical protein
MRPRRNKIELSPLALRDFLKVNPPRSLKELMLFFAGTEEELQYALFLAVESGYLIYYPPQRKAQARWAFDGRNKSDVAGPRISPLAPAGELKYDLYAHARLAAGFRRQ